MKLRQNALDRTCSAILRNPRILRSVLLLFVLGTAAFWRFYRLDYRCLWYDEIQVAKVAERNNLTDVVLGARGHLSAPPVDYLLRRVWQRLGGLSDAWLRAYGGVWGVVAVLLTWRIGDRVFGPRTGLLGALLLGVSWFHVRYSAEVKFYSLLVVVYLAVILAWLSALRRSDIWGWATFAFAGVLGAYTHPYAVFSVAFCVVASSVQWLVCWTERRTLSQDRVQFLHGSIAAAVVALLYLPWVLWDFVGQPKGWAPPEMSWHFIYATVHTFLPKGPLGIGLALVGSVFAVWGGVHKQQHHALPLWLTVIFSVFLVWLLDIFGHYPLMTKQLVFVQPCFLLLIAEGVGESLDYLTTRIKLVFTARRCWAGAGIIAIGTVVFVSANLDLWEEKDPAKWLQNNWRKVISTISEEMRPSDSIAWAARQGSNDPTYSTVVEWYLERSGRSPNSIELVEWWEPRVLSLNDIYELAEMDAQRGIWLFGQELDRVFEEGRIADVLQRTLVGNVRIYYIPDIASWRLELLDSGPRIVYLDKSESFGTSVFLNENYVYQLSLALAGSPSTTCSIRTELDGSVQDETNLDSTLHSQNIVSYMHPASSGEHTVQIIPSDSCDSLVLTEAKLVPMRRIDLASHWAYRAEVWEMKLSGNAQAQTDANLRSFIWEYSSGDASQFWVWVDVPGRCRLSVHAASWGPPPAVLNILLNKRLVGKLEFYDRWETASTVVQIPAAGPHRISLVFSNDYSGPDGDRNTRIDWAEIEPLGTASLMPMQILDLWPLAANYQGGVSLEDGELAMWWADKAIAAYEIVSGAYTLSVQARGQQGCDIWPVVDLYIDGNKVGSQQVSSAESKVYELQVVLGKDGEHSIGVEFAQPGKCDQPGQDVNLFIQGIFLERTGDAPVLEPTPDVARTLDLAPLAAGYHGGVALGERGELGMWWAGSAMAAYDIVSGTYTLTVQARGQRGCETWPVSRLLVDGTERGAQEVTSAEIGTYEFPQVVFDASGKHSIGIEFVQPEECNEPGQDVNLFVHQVSLERATSR